MTLTQEGLGSFGALARAIGLLTDTGTNSAWFGDPVGGDSNQTGLKTILSDPGQRDALLGFVDEVLGPPDARTDGTQRWVPLFQNSDPLVTLSRHCPAPSASAWRSSTRRVPTRRA
jgi:large repetitive protein